MTDPGLSAKVATSGEELVNGSKPMRRRINGNVLPATVPIPLPPTRLAQRVVATKDSAGRGRNRLRPTITDPAGRGACDSRARVKPDELYGSQLVKTLELYAQSQLAGAISGILGTLRAGEFAEGGRRCDVGGRRRIVQVVRQVGEGALEFHVNPLA